MKMIVFAGLSTTVVDAKSHADAKLKVLEEFGLVTKPWLADPWRVRVATPDEVERHKTAAKVTEDRRKRRSHRAVPETATLF